MGGEKKARERKRSREKGRKVGKKTKRVTENKEERKEGSYIERVLGLLGSKIKWLFIPKFS